MHHDTADHLGHPGDIGREAAEQVTPGPRIGERALTPVIVKVVHGARLAAEYDIASGKYFPVWKAHATLLLGKCSGEGAMEDGLRPDEAAQALAEIERRREQVIELAIIPAWYWWAIAGLMVGLSAAVDSRQPLAVGIGTGAFVVGVLATTGWIVAGMLRRGRVRNDLVGRSGVLAILGFVATVEAVALPTAFALDAAGAAYPATWGMLGGAVVMAVGGPLLMRRLRRIMLANRPGRHQ
jgi:hypothetical protein